MTSDWIVLKEKYHLLARQEKGHSGRSRKREEHRSSLMLIATFTEGVPCVQQCAKKLQLYLQFIEEKTKIQRCWLAHGYKTVELELKPRSRAHVSNRCVHGEL